MADVTEVTKELAKALADPSKPPEPTAWVRAAQLFLAGVCIVGALVFALIQIHLENPAPEKPGNAGGDTTTESEDASRTLAAASPILVTAAPETGTTPDAGGAVGPSGESGTTGEGGPTGGEGPSGDTGATGEEGQRSTIDSLTDLNEQAPWAFAIVALLVGAFIATGKSLNFSNKSEP